MQSEHFRICDYLYCRLQALGVKHVFGVPGDYSLSLIHGLSDYHIDFIGNCNELNAG